MIPDPGDQLAELIVYITSTRVDLYSHQILFSMFQITLYLCIMQSILDQQMLHECKARHNCIY